MHNVIQSTLDINFNRKNAMFVELQSHKNREFMALQKENHIITKNRTSILKQKKYWYQNKYYLHSYLVYESLKPYVFKTFCIYSSVLILPPKNISIPLKNCIPTPNEITKFLLPSPILTHIINSSLISIQVLLI